jgi:NAD(P)-dependent dehydrogenase (short-subunit alcohol dehydrogenase family)
MGFMKLENKILVVIGGTRGLGQSAAKAFMAEGAKVVAVGRDPDKAQALEQASQQSVITLVAEASDPQTAPMAIDVALNEFGGFDGLYHVAGGSGRAMGDGPLHELSDAGWIETLNLNLNSLFYSNRAAVQHLLSKGTPGAILNMTSVLAFSPSPKFFASHAYATAKAAIIGLTKANAAYYAPQNIRFNALAPGLVATPMSERAQGDETIMKYIKTKQPLDGGRISHPPDLDAAAVYFMSDASKFVTGQVLSVDGGWGMSEGQWQPSPDQ